MIIGARAQIELLDSYLANSLDLKCQAFLKSTQMLKENKGSASRPPTARSSWPARAILKENSALDARFEAYQDAAEKHRFRLKAANNQIIGVGEAYESEANRKNGIESVKRWAPGAEIKEL